MGEPEPLDLRLLKDGDNDEIRCALHELELVSMAERAVYGVIGSRYPDDVGAVANLSLQELLTRAIHKCRTIDDIRPMLGTIARRRGINFLNVAYRRWERQFGEDLPGLREQPAAHEVDPFDVLGDLVAEGLGMGRFDLAPVLEFLVEHAGLNVVEQHLLAEHIVQGCTQANFSERHGLPLKGIGGRKDRLLSKIRVFLAGEFTGEVRAEFLQILRRKR